MPTYTVIETITIQKEVEASSPENARAKAYEVLPDYESAGWELSDSQGPEIISGSIINERHNDQAGLDTAAREALRDEIKWIDEIKETICCDHCGHEYDRHVGDDCPNCGHNNHDQYEEKFGK